MTTPSGYVREKGCRNCRDGYFLHPACGRHHDPANPHCPEYPGECYVDDGERKLWRVRNIKPQDITATRLRIQILHSNQQNHGILSGLTVVHSLYDDTCALYWREP